VHRQRRATQVKVPEIFQVETPQAPEGLASVLHAIAGAGTGVARVCLAIRAAPEKAFDYTYLGRAVAIVTDGSAILGLGNIGPRAGLPVIEGKALCCVSLDCSTPYCAPGRGPSTTPCS